MQLQTFLTNLNLDQEEATIYQALAQKGTQTVLQLSKQTNINRSKIYRRLERLQNLNLVEEIIAQHTTRYQISDINQLEQLLAQKEQTTKHLRNIFPDIKNSIVGQIGLHDPSTQVKFYRGKQGIRQMIWNVLKIKDVGVGYSYRPIYEIVGEDFTHRWSEEFKNRNLKFRDLINPEYKTHKGAKNLDPGKIISSEYFSSKIIDKDTLTINFQTDIYNDTVAYYNWHEGEVF